MKPRSIVSVIVTVIACGILFAMYPQAPGAADVQPRGTLDKSIIASAERDQRCRLSQNEVAVLQSADATAPSRVAESKGIVGKTVAEGTRFVILDVGKDTSNIHFDDPAIAPVFRSGSGPEAPFLFPTGEVIVRFKLRTNEKQVAAWGGARGLVILRPMEITNAFLLRAANPSKSLEAATMAATSDRVAFCVPNWMRKRSLRQADPLYPYQWHLKNTGEVRGTVAGNDINAEAVWATYKGSPGQIISIVDNGLEIAHKDLAANIVPGLSWDYVRKQADPTEGDHGTACGGVTAARGYNGIGARGVAPEAGLCGYRIMDGGKISSDADEADSQKRYCDRVSVFSNSWGPPDTGQKLDAIIAPTRAAMEEGMASGRGGRGAIYVRAGGNGLQFGDNSNYDGYANHRATIAVGASDSAGRQSFYSEPGANLCVNAPSDGGGDTGITTVDRSGPVGYNKTGEAQGDFSDLDFTNGFGGTSSACPVVSGVCALMLQANPGLGWRDVKKILAVTASKNDPSDTDWTANAAGYHVDHKYGFGRVDAAAAVIAAAAWTNLAPEVNAEGTVSPGMAIPIGNGGVASSITLTRSIVVENVEVYFTADHLNWGDLSVILTAPSGTSSVLAEKHDTSGTESSYDGWRFGTGRHLGEMSAGDWTLTVRDLGGTTPGGTFTNWRLVVYGTDPSANAVTLATHASPAEGGTVSPAGTSRLYQGVAAGIVATAAPGYYFTGWVASPEANVTFGFGGKGSPEASVTLSGDATLTAHFSTTPPQTAIVTFSPYPTAGGFTDPGEQATVNVGAGLAITALASTGYRFVTWAADPAQNAEFASAGSASTIARITGDVAITARFRPPDVNLTQGSVALVPAGYLEIEAFSKRPKVSGMIGPKTYAMKVIGEFPSEAVTAEWPKSAKIYDPEEYKDPPHGLGALLEDKPITPVNLQLLVVDATKADGAKLDLVSLAACAVAPPTIEMASGDFAEGSEIQFMGTHFGTKPPKVSIEYLMGGKHFTKACALVKEFRYQDASGKPSCMDPLVGESLVVVVYPALPSGAEPTGYFILENPIAMCSFYRMPREMAQSGPCLGE